MSFGPDARGDELPSALRRREDRLAAIRAATERLEAAQRAADEAGGRQPGQARNPKGGRPYKRGYGEPDEKAQSNFTDPQSGIREAFKPIRERIERWTNAFESAGGAALEQCLVVYRDQDGDRALRAQHTRDLRLQRTDE